MKQDCLTLGFPVFNIYHKLLINRRLLESTLSKTYAAIMVQKNKTTD